MNKFIRSIIYFSLRHRYFVFFMTIVLVALGVWIMVMLNKAVGAHPTHPVQQMFGRGAGMLTFVYVLASIWAPIIEETMFRGALFSHLRSRVGWWISAPIVSVIFAAIHPQGWVAIPVLSAIALVLAGLREWRGSAIASMVAHATNNAVAVTVMILMLK